jgi:5-methylcytosine-specific restriction endonuclease McrA
MVRFSVLQLSQLSRLSPAAARRRLLGVDLDEKAMLAEGLALIGLIDARGDHLEAGYTSMHAYCVGALRMSGDRALKRLQAARLARRFPAVLERVADGRLTVTTVCELAPHLTDANAGALLEAAAYHAQLEVRQIARSWSGRQGGTAAEHVSSPAAAHADPQVSASAASPAGAPDFALAPPGPASSHAVPHVNSPIRRGQVSRDGQGNYVLRLTFTPAQHADLSAAQDLLAHAVRDGDPTEVVARALAHFVTHLCRRRFGAGTGGNATTLPASPARALPRGRAIPIALRRVVAERDGHACTFVGVTGHRCGATRGLQFDHLIPLAQGGATTAANLRLLCAAHNRHEARRLLGSERVRRQRERSDRQRARDAEAKRRELQRQSDREARAQARSRANELIPALRHLGFTRQEASEGAQSAEAIANEPLEARLRLALKTLTRPVLDRGERRGRAAG